MRLRSRVDDNQKEIITAFRGLGCSVKPVHQIKGFVDIVVGYRGANHLIEIKDGSKSASRKKLTKDEQAFWMGWRGESPKIVESTDDVANLVKEWGD